MSHEVIPWLALFGGFAAGFIAAFLLSRQAGPEDEVWRAELRRRARMESAVRSDLVMRSATYGSASRIPPPPLEETVL